MSILVTSNRKFCKIKPIIERELFMTQNFEYKGYWFLPSDPKNKIAGILTYLPNESMKLELIGAFGKVTSPIIAFTNSTRIDIIWGITSDAQKISLIDCFPGGGSYNFSCPFPLIEYKIQYCLVGAYIENFKDELFNRSDIIMPAASIRVSTTISAE